METPPEALCICCILGLWVSHGSTQTNWADDTLRETESLFVFLLLLSSCSARLFQWLFPQKSLSQYTDVVITKCYLIKSDIRSLTHFLISSKNSSNLRLLRVIKVAKLQTVSQTSAAQVDSWLDFTTLTQGTQASPGFFLQPSLWKFFVGEPRGCLIPACEQQTVSVTSFEFSAA